MRGSFDCRLPPTPARTSSRRRSTWTSPRAPNVTRRGWVLFAAMAVIWGIPYLLIKIAVGELTPVTLVFLRTALGAALLLPIGVVAASLVLTAVAYAPLGLQQLPAAMPSPRVLFAVGTLAVLCTALAFLLFFALIAEVGPVRATVITYFNPAVALLLGVTLLHEPLTIGAVIGLALILLGSFYATRTSSGPAAGAAGRASSPWAVAARYRRERLRRVQGSGK